MRIFCSLWLCLALIVLASCDNRSASDTDPIAVGLDALRRQRDAARMNPQFHRAHQRYIAAIQEGIDLLERQPQRVRSQPILLYARLIEREDGHGLGLLWLSIDAEVVGVEIQGVPDDEPVQYEGLREMPQETKDWADLSAAKDLSIPVKFGAGGGEGGTSSDGELPALILPTRFRDTEGLKVRLILKGGKLQDPAVPLERTLETDDGQ